MHVQDFQMPVSVVFPKIADPIPATSQIPRRACQFSWKVFGDKPRHRHPEVTRERRSVAAVRSRSARTILVSRPQCSQANSMRSWAGRSSFARGCHVVNRRLRCCLGTRPGETDCPSADRWEPPRTAQARFSAVPGLGGPPAPPIARPWHYPWLRSAVPFQGASALQRLLDAVGPAEADLERVTYVDASAKGTPCCRRSASVSSLKQGRPVRMRGSASFSTALAA